MTETEKVKTLGGICREIDATDHHQANIGEALTNARDEIMRLAGLADALQLRVDRLKHQASNQADYEELKKERDEAWEARDQAISMARVDSVVEGEFSKRITFKQDNLKPMTLLINTQHQLGNVLVVKVAVEKDGKGLYGNTLGFTQFASQDSKDEATFFGPH